MPFDGTDFPERCDPPRRPARDDNAATVIIVVIALILLAMPLSMTAFVDIVRYMRGN